VLRWRKKHGGVSRLLKLAIEMGLEVPAAGEGEGTRTLVSMHVTERGRVTLSHSISIESAAVFSRLLLSAAA
jgi:hypothetical protein